MNYDNTGSFIVLDGTNNDCEIVGTAVYNNFSYPAKLTINITKATKIIIYDNHKLNLNDEVIRCIFDNKELPTEPKRTSTLDSNLTFYCNINGVSSKIKFVGLRAWISIFNNWQINAICEYCVISSHAEQEVDLNSKCDVEFSLANIGSNFWTSLMDPELKRDNFDLYDDCKLSIKYQGTCYSLLPEFCSNLIPRTIDKQKYYKDNQTEINDAFNKFITDHKINITDINQKINIEFGLFKLSNTTKPIEDVLNILILFKIIFKRDVYLSRLRVSNKDIKANILYSFQINKEELSRGLINGFGYSIRALITNPNTFEKWLTLCKKQNLFYSTIIPLATLAKDHIYYSGHFLMELIYSLECIGFANKPDKKSYDITHGLSYSVDNVIDDLYKNLFPNCHSNINNEIKLEQIANQLVSIRNPIAHGLKNGSRDVNELKNIFSSLENGLVNLLEKSIKCYIYKQIDLKDEYIKAF